jgi:outer membrane protein OmpA-like peptidoglycan-associated protein
MQKPLLLCILLFGKYSTVLSQSSTLEQQPVYYAVVGTFTNENNAKRLMRDLKHEGIQSNQIFNQSTRVYYVYTEQSQSRTKIEQTVQQLRLQPKFYDAWCRGNPENKINPDVEAIAPKLSGKRPPRFERTIEDFGETPSSNATRNPQALFKVYDAETTKPVRGKIKIIDVDEAALIDEVPANEKIRLGVEHTGKKLAVICDVFGYYPMQTDMNLAPPHGANVQYADPKRDKITIHFPLVRYRKGDVVSLFNVYFYNDAAIMMNESRFQLKELLALMMDNPEMKIRLHGHCNGSHFGKIIFPASDNDLFKLDDSSGQTFGSAKVLSLKRAETVRAFLIQNGVTANRISVKAVGGKKPLYDKHSANAKKNLRVDVEILGD